MAPPTTEADPSASSPDSDWETTLRDDLGLRDRETTAVLDAWPDEDAIVTYLVNGGDLTEKPGVGNQTSSRLWRWFENTHPEKDQERRDRDEAYCRTFTTEHGIDADTLEEDTFYFAFICPRCDATNPLVGDPAGFGNRPYRCENCNWVPLLDGDAIDSFRDEHYDE